MDTVADSLAYEDSTRDIISDLRSVYSQSKTQIHVQPSAVKTRERNDGMSEVLPPHTVGIIATTNVSAMEPAVVSHTRSVSGYNDGIDLLNNSLLSTELGLSTFPRSKILSSNMSPMVSSSFFSNTLEACTTTRNPLGKDSLLGIPSSSFSPRSMGSDLFSTRQMASEKHVLTPVYHSDNHYLNSETKSAKVSAKNQDELKGENTISEDVVMMGALSNPTCVNGRSGIEEDYGEIVSASIEVVLNKSNGSTNLKKRSHTGFDPSLITSLDRTESVKRLSIESGDVIALGNSGINTSSGIEPHSSHTSSEGLDITSATDSNSKSKLRSKTDNNLPEGEEKSSDTFHKLPIIKKRRRLRKPKNGAERDTIDDIFRNYL